MATLTARPASSIWPSSLGTYDGSQYPSTGNAQGSIARTDTRTDMTSFTDMWSQMGKIWQAYMSEQSKRSGTTHLTLVTQDSSMTAPPNTQLTYGSSQTQPPSSASLESLLSVASSFQDGTPVIKPANNDLVAAVLRMGLNEEELREHCKDYLNSITPQARIVTDIVDHSGFWSFILKNRTGIGRIEAPSEPATQELVQNLTAAAWTYLYQDQRWNDAQDNSVASSFISPPGIAAPSFGSIMPEFPPLDSPGRTISTEDAYDMQYEPHDGDTVPGGLETFGTASDGLEPFDLDESE